jgi:hypothetical protein
MGKVKLVNMYGVVQCLVIHKITAPFIYGVCSGYYTSYCSNKSIERPIYKAFDKSYKCG